MLAIIFDFPHGPLSSLLEIALQRLALLIGPLRLHPYFDIILVSGKLLIPHL